MVQLAVIMTCHNRRAVTLRCLRSLDAAAKRSDGMSYHVYLTDDGSTDDTSAAVEALGLPVTILSGPGDLFWNRGMVRAWESAAVADTSYDAYMLLNDDTVLDDDALERLEAVERQTGGRAVVVGAVRDPDTGTLTYGGVRRLSTWHPGRVATVGVHDHPQSVDTFHANCVLVPSAVFATVGTLDPTYHHGMGDFDYGYRAREHGFHVIVAPRTVGTCARNRVDGTCRDPSLPLRRRLTLLASPKGLPRRQWHAFLMRHGAPAAYLLSWVPTLQVVFSWLSSSKRWKRSV